MPLWTKESPIVTENDIAIPAGVFTRADLLAAIEAEDKPSQSQVRSLLGSLMAAGRIVRVGRGRYIATRGPAKPVWQPAFSQEAEKASGLLSARFPLLDFRIWELAWLNEFLNHLVARNAVLACVEADGREFAFDALAEAMPGKVLLGPSVDDLVRYGTDGTVAVVRLVSEAPKARAGGHGASVEQVVVDLVAEKLIRGAIPRGDLPEALAAMFGRYSVDQVAMFRYARRRNKEPELRHLLDGAGIGLYA